VNLIFPSVYCSLSNAAASLSCGNGQGRAVEVQHPRGAQGLSIPLGMFPFKDGP